MQKIVVISQHFPPDDSTTAGIMASIAEKLATKYVVLVLSGMSGSTLPHVIEIKNWSPGKGALMKRGLVESLFTIRSFFALLKYLKRGDMVLTVTAPFTLPYAVAVAAWLKRSSSVLIMHDLYPHVLVLAGILKADAFLSKIIHGFNRLLFWLLAGVVVIGRDTADILLEYKSLTRDNLYFIPNWATLPFGVRSISSANMYRQACAAKFIVGMSGNLGFTHDPDIVYDAAERLSNQANIHFLLSGWGVGFERLKARQSRSNLTNVTIVDRVPDDRLDDFLSSADVWIIPYRKNIAGVSVPSRFYNLLAIGRPVILVSEAGAEAALTVMDDDLGWVVRPGDADDLAAKIKLASAAKNGERALRASTIASDRFSRDQALDSYLSMADDIMRKAAR